MDLESGKWWSKHLTQSVRPNWQSPYFQEWINLAGGDQVLKSQGSSQGLSSPLIIIRDVLGRQIYSCLNMCQICFCHSLQVICKVIEVGSNKCATLLEHKSFDVWDSLDVMFIASMWQQRREAAKSCYTGDASGIDWLADWRNASDNKWNASSDN